MEEEEKGRKPEVKPKPLPLNNSQSQSGKNNLIEALINHDQALTTALERVEAKTEESEGKVKALEGELEQLLERKAASDKEIDKLQEKNSSAKGNEEMQHYLLIYERLKNDEKIFKATCNKELERLQEELRKHDEMCDDNSLPNLQANLAKQKERIEAGRIELASLTRKVAVLKRQIEQVPNRTELREYRLRFSELYNQVSGTHRSTKQFFSLYNSLEDTKRYLEKEVSLLNSIVDSFQLVSGSPSGREEFVNQLQNTHEGMKDTCSKVEKRLQSEKAGVEKMHLEFQKLLDMKVAYEKGLKELESECKRNDALLAEYNKALENKEASINNQLI